MNRRLKQRFCDVGVYCVHPGNEEEEARRKTRKRKMSINTESLLPLPLLLLLLIYPFVGVVNTPLYRNTPFWIKLLLLPLKPLFKVLNNRVHSFFSFSFSIFLTLFAIRMQSKERKRVFSVLLQKKRSLIAEVTFLNVQRFLLHFFRIRENCNRKCGISLRNNVDL